MKKTFLAALALCALFLVTTGSAHAQVINACVGKLTGLVRIVNSPSNCTALEKAISWNAIGPQGPPGVANGIKAAVYGTIANSTQFDCANDTLTLYPNPAPFTVDHTDCKTNAAGYGYGPYKFTFTPNPFTPSTTGANRPTCMAVGRNNPSGTTCSTAVGFNVFSGDWNVEVDCINGDFTNGFDRYDADFDLICVQ